MRRVANCYTPFTFYLLLLLLRSDVTAACCIYKVTYYVVEEMSLIARLQHAPFRYLVSLSFVRLKMEISK